MILKAEKKEGQTGGAKVNRASSKVSTACPKVNKVNPTVNRAYSQFRDSGILFALANGKLYFGATGMFPSHQNHLPLQGAKTRSEVGVFNRNF